MNEPRVQDDGGAAAMRGRRTEWGLVLDLLESAGRGQGGVLLVEGEPGAGKTKLLSVASEFARARGLVLATSAVDELSRLTSPWQVGGLRSHLRELALAGPALLSVDDLQWSDPATLHALRSLPGQLAAHPLAWILARGTHGGSPEAEVLFDALEHAGGIRTCLSPLAEEDQAALMADVLSGVPDAGLIDYAARAAGNPFMLTEFLRGLLEEEAIGLDEGHASLLSPRVPERFRAAVRSHLGRLAARTKYLLETGSVLGRSFRLEDAAEMLGLSPGSLLAEVDEALTARIIVAGPESIAFQHELVWQTVADSLPGPVAQALHRQAGEMLLARGEDTVTAAHHLLAGARPGDAVALAGIDQAVAEALCSSPSAAAELAVRALNLTRLADPGRYPRTVTAVRALTVAGRWEEAELAARSALITSAPAGGGAELRPALASLHALRHRAAEALTEAETILEDPALAPEVRDSAKVALLQALTGSRENQRATQVARAILAEPRAGRAEVTVAALLMLALVSWDAGRVSEALDLAAEAMRAEAGEPWARWFHPGLFLATRLVDIHRFADAEALMNSIGRMDMPAVLSWTASSVDVLRARIALTGGRMSDAVAEAGLALGRASAEGTRLHDLLARSILATVALRRGDLAAAQRHVGKSPFSLPHSAVGYEAAWSLVVSAQVEEAQSGPYAALDRLGGLYADLQEHRYLLASHPVSAVWLVRVALAADDRDRADMAARVMAEISRANPAVPLFRASADHARGVRESDQSRLELAVASYEDRWARTSAAEDLGDVHAAAGRRKEGVHFLDMALAGYDGTGAERDAARIRHKLRGLGVRRRHWHSMKRPRSGWNSLTETERSVAELVATGLTNQQVASQMFISAHTVAFHLRQVFRKLDIQSRVELARAALERTTPPAPAAWPR